MKQSYIDLLKRPEWKSKRFEILKRDNFECTSCPETQSLHVHHTVYYNNRLPWEYFDEELITLCKTCHDKAHEGRHISTFYKKEEKPFQEKPRFFIIEHCHPFKPNDNVSYNEFFKFYTEGEIVELLETKKIRRTCFHVNLEK
jgi:hypothetical protein